MMFKFKSDGETFTADCLNNIGGVHANKLVNWLIIILIKQLQMVH